MLAVDPMRSDSLADSSRVGGILYYFLPRSSLDSGLRRTPFSIGLMLLIFGEIISLLNLLLSSSNSIISKSSSLFLSSDVIEGLLQFESGRDSMA